MFVSPAHCIRKPNDFVIKMEPSAERLASANVLFERITALDARKNFQRSLILDNVTENTVSFTDALAALALDCK